MRLLHARFRDVALRRLLPEEFEDACATGRATRGKFVSLHRLSSDQCRRGRGICVQDRQLSSEQERENREAVHQAWRLGFSDNLHSLQTGFYQGWDLHPAQLVTRYAAVYSFFLESLDAASKRLSAFVEKAALASLYGDVFDDAATGQGLLNFFLRGIACGAITEDEALATGLSLDELRSRSFLKILQGRRKQ